MDTNLRTLMGIAQKYGAKDPNNSLQQVYDQLRNVAQSKPTIDAPEPFGQELYVLCAEIAFQHGKLDMAKDCLKMYFIKPPPANQFLCRAYLCQSQLLAPTSADNPEQLEKAVVYLVKAINFAKKNPRYHFLVYNASVLYWQFCRPFLKPNFRRFLAHSLHEVVKALDDIDDQDFEWRATLIIALIECHLDAGRKKDAEAVGLAAASFIRSNVPSMYKRVFGMLIQKQLMPVEKLHRDVQKSPELAVYYKICRLKVGLEAREVKDILWELRRIYIMIVEGREPKELPKEGRKDREGRRSVTPGGSIMESEGRRSGKRVEHIRTPTPPFPKRFQLEADVRPHLLMELARMCLEQNQADLAQDCVLQIRECVIKEPDIFIELEFVNAELMVKLLRDKQQSYQKGYVEVRLQAIKKCSEALMNAIRANNPHVIQAGCVTQWNLCLPLLQNNLRKNARKPLTLVAEALENIQSLLVLLRCQVHTELAKCEEDEEQIVVAMEHLKKALSLDDGGVYRERLEVMLHRLQLRAQLYEQPERPEDQAAMIIEQARKADSGTIRMKRSLLVRAGLALAPDAFQLVLDSENETKVQVSGNVKGPVNKAFQKVYQLAGRARQFEKSIKKAAGHLKRLGDENDRERARLWGDLAKVARKQEVWDVCRVASRFCILYDDSRWKSNLPDEKISKSKRSNTIVRETTQARDNLADVDTRTEASMESSATLQAEGTDLGASGSRKKKGDSRPGSPTRKEVGLYDRDLVRMLAEVHFIYGEGMVHLLRSQGVELNDIPTAPKDTSKHPKGYIPKKPADDPEWAEYCDWIRSLSKCAQESFMRASVLGSELKEPWILCSAAAYIWNYNNHILTQFRHREILDIMITVLEGIRAVGHAGETTLLTNLCNAIAQGLILPWIPVEETKDGTVITAMTDDASAVGSKADIKKKQSVLGSMSKGKIQLQIPAEANDDLKKALSTCKFGLDVTNGSIPTNMVPIAIRQPLLQTWVKVKQMINQQIDKKLGTDDEESKEGQKPMTRCIVATEMLTLNGNGLMEFREGPNLAETVEMVSECEWADKLVELQIWTRLSSLAHSLKDHEHVMLCSNKALAFADVGTQPKGKTADSHKAMVEQEMLCFASCIQGQSLMENMAGSNAVRRQALAAFLNSARFARNANNAKLVMTAARHYWNSVIPLVKLPMERELLKEPLRMMLQCINATAPKKIVKEDKGSDDEGETGGEPGLAALKEAAVTTGAGDPDDDIALRAALYGVMFQSYADSGDWENGLMEMEQAVNDMPRTKHRLLIFKHLIIAKAKTGKNVGMSIQKFQNESEDYVAHMWRRVALCSKEQLEQLEAYQKAIEALESEPTQWQKFDYLLEFGQWLYCNEFPLNDALDQLEWTIDILLNMKFERPSTRQSQRGGERGSKAAKGSKKKGKKERGKTPPPPASGGQKAKKSTSKDKIAEKERMAKEEEEKLKAAEVSSQKTSDSESELNAADFIPVVKESIIGIVPSNSGLTLNDLIDVKQLEGLVRGHTMLAQLSGRASEKHQDYALQAYGFLMKIWQVSLQASGPVVKEIVKNNILAEAEKKEKGGSAKKKKDKDNKEEKKDKPKRKGPLEHLPQNVEEWSTYDVPEEVLEAFKHDSIKGAGVNEKTIAKPMLTFYYLEELVSQLRSLGYNHLALPVLSFAELVAKDIIKSRPLSALCHFKCMEVCLELNLLSAASLHEKAAHVFLHEEEQAKARGETIIWQENQRQVSKEEKRVKESLEKLAIESKSLSRRPTRANVTAPNVNPPKVPDEQSPSHLGKQISGVEIRDVWTETAIVLIRQHMYQPARNLLNEAYQSAKAFNDKQLLGKVLTLFGQLAYNEAQFGQAINFANEAQSCFEGDEMYWFETTMLVAESAMADYALKHDGKRKARNILTHALNVFSIIAEERRNKPSITGYILAKIEAKLGEVQAAITKEDWNTLKPKVVNALSSACKKYQHGIDRLVKLGYKREALPLMKEEARILIHLAQKSRHISFKHDFYLQALDVLKEANYVAEEVMHNIQTLNPLFELRNVSLPIHREAADIKVMYGEVMVEMFKQHATETREKQLEEERKEAVVKLVEEMTRETPNYTDVEQDWLDTTKVVAETAVIELTAAHSLSGNISHLKARSLCALGTCLRLMAEYTSPDQPKLWDVDNMNIINNVGSQPNLAQEKTDDEADESADAPQLTRQETKMMHEASRMSTSTAMSHHYMSQATECLTQTLHIALQKGYTEIAGAASLQLVECCGQYDPSSTSQYLALHQSCQAAIYMKGLLDVAQKDPTISQQAAMMHQKTKIEKMDVTTNLSQGSTMKTIQKTLQDNSVPWNRLSISANHLEIIKEFPPYFNIIVMQHSPDRHYLYGAILDKPKPAHAGGKESKKNAQLQGLSKAKVVRIPTSPESVDRMCQRAKDHRNNVMTILLKQEYQRSQQAMRQKMLENLDDDLKHTGMTPFHEEMVEDEDQLENEFKDIVTDLETYIDPIIKHFDTNIRPQSSTTDGKGRKDKDHDKNQDACNQEYIVLLADQWLLELPLEAVQRLQADNISSLSRDISLQMMYHRHHEDTGEDESPSHGKDKDDKKEKKKEKSKEKEKAYKPPPRIPGLRDAAKKQNKIIPLDRPLAPGLTPVDTHAFRYVCDAYCDCAETETHAPLEIFHRMMEEHVTQFTPRWLGVEGTEHSPSVGEFEIYMIEGSAFVFYGMERFMSYITPQKLASLSIPENCLVMLFDLAQTSKSFTRQSSGDVLKSNDIMHLERPLETAMLLSLTGVKCVMSNQWHCTLMENADRLEASMRDLLPKGKSTGQVARYLLSPAKRRSDELEAERLKEEAENKNKTGDPDPKAKGHEADGQEVDDEEEVEPVEPPMEPNRSWYNMVCYGMPNIVVTQLSK
ncbi:unnamed protein product [Owenia fusiformis]|uniref:Cilia- and flagella-associated protein 46 n=1 Tax=Owenia fusiformis TaxID=6347 RepID=A0A8S4NX10_OWEFU|nr:unnamed protein product [Owenia fusiformis]